MLNSQERMGQEHARTREAHDLLDPGTHICFITMDRALCAGGLALLEGAIIELLQCIVLQFLALIAQIRYTVMLFPTIEKEHGL